MNNGSRSASSDVTLSVVRLIFSFSITLYWYSLILLLGKPVFYFPTSLTSDESEEIRTTTLQHVLATDGPFAQVNKCRLHGLVTKACTLSPSGLPKVGVAPMKEHLSPDGLYEKFLRSIFTRTIRIPLASRWHTVEKTCAFLLLLMRTGMMKFELTNATNMAYWPGDSIRIDDLKGADYRRKSSARLKRVLEYTPIVDFEKDLTICFVGSIPKWRLVRCVEMKREDSTKTDVGINHGLKRYRDDILIILDGKNETVENLVNSFSVPSMIPRVRLE